MGSQEVGFQKSPPWKTGVQAAWANRWPGAALAVFAICLVLGYYYISSVHTLFTRIAEFKQSTGWIFPIISTILFGAVIPWLVQRLRPAEHEAVLASHLLFFIVFWGYKGAETDGFYHLQAWLFGEGNNALLVLKKIAFDMLVFVPLWATPTVVWAYAWKERHLTVKGYRKRDPNEPRLTFWQWYTHEVFPVMISNWAVWTPAVVAIYLLPLALQLPMQNLVLCFWSLMLMWQVRSVRKEEAEAHAGA